MFENKQILPKKFVKYLNLFTKKKVWLSKSTRSTNDFSQEVKICQQINKQILSQKIKKFLQCTFACEEEKLTNQDQQELSMIFQNRLKYVCKQIDPVERIQNQKKKKVLTDEDNEV
eukprot:TRINITY_DN11630_c0_g1_i1.p4 TRINITY_DN11630_c0_g1~~TRINITY_DN11630_c0_g1_i1.p4  ORF type:complete len:116 (+),score=10.10 TRINITY_DN11630_c0_g1_i1:337-684(+)